MKIRFIFIIIIVFSFEIVKSQSEGVLESIFYTAGKVECSDENWKLIFYDEFNGTSLDLTKWRTTYPYGPPGDRLHGYDEDSQEFLEAQVYLDENVVVQNGYLRLIAKKENVLYEGYNKSYSSGMINTIDPFDFMYGKFEIRAKIPYGRGFWPAFWLYGGPNANEIDIFEFGGHAPDELHTNIHTEVTGEHLMWSKLHDLGINFSDTFHIFSVEWGPNEMHFRVDGILIRSMYKTYTLSRVEPLPCDISYGTGMYFHNYLMPINEMHLILNLAITSESYHPFTDPPNSSTIFPNQFQIDYVRVYQRTLQSGYTDLCNSRRIVGDDNICDGDSKTYTFGASGDLIWNTSSNLMLIDSSTNSITVKAISSNLNYDAWISVEDNSTICGNIIFKKNVWIGKPAVQIVGLTELAPNHSAIYTASRYYDCSVDSYDWTILSPLYAFSYFPDNTESYEIETRNNLGTFYLYLITTNSCGTQNLMKNIVVKSSSSGGGGLVPRSVELPIFTISPNPANTQIEIEILMEASAKDNNPNIKVTIFNNMSVLVYKNNFKNRIFNIDVSDFSSGYYVIKIIYNGEKQSSHLLIEH